MGDATMPNGGGESAVLAEQDDAGWNVLVTLDEGKTLEARRLLRRWGKAHSTGFYHVLAMHVADVARFIVEFDAAVAQSPGILNILSHVVPARATFDFHSPAEFEARAADIVRGWAGDLAGRRFHVRLHRRGFKGVLSTPHEETFLDTVLLEALQAAGRPGRIDFDDPDAVIQIETINGRAGLSLWSREELRHYGFLGLL